MKQFISLVIPLAAVILGSAWSIDAHGATPTVDSMARYDHRMDSYRINRYGPEKINNYTVSIYMKVLGKKGEIGG